jgi:stage II sporulation protein AA (anti-sigma F factor antagonist)
LKIEFQKEKSILTAFLSGEIDHHSARGFREEIDFAIDKKDPQLLILDFSAVTFTDSSGIGLVMGRYRLMKLKGGKILAINMSPRIKKIFSLSGLSKLGIVEEDYKYERTK